jgi:A/G-specific adenine glycosylase
MPAESPTNGHAHVAEALLAWYARERRILPWRAAPGARQDPYLVWLSEIMLQQTTVKAVLPRYAEFLQRFPTIQALAAAELGEVLAAWAGLGYYARARNLHACAQEVVQRRGGRFPETEAALRTLPGVGGYTAAAIAAIAFGQQAAPVEGNIERVVARLFCVTTPLPEAKAEIAALAAALVPPEAPGDFAQAMMDLGASICTPRRPACGLCLVRQDCAGFAAGLQEVLPYRQPKPERPLRRGAAFVVLRSDGCVLLRERPPKGLLGGMLEVPSTPWEGALPAEARLFDHAPLSGAWERVPGLVSHTFTHFHLELAVYAIEADPGAPLTIAADPGRCRWVPRRDLAGAALPSVMRKVLAHAFTALARKEAPRPKAPASPLPLHARRRSA